ncbi:MAG: ATP-dependent sacrificial sulfur transferase LarE [Methanoregula sp.]
MTLSDKQKQLKATIAGKGSMLVAYSGGVDSTLLADIAHEMLQEKMRCVLLDSEVVPRAAVSDAKKLAGDLGLPLEVISLPLLEDGIFCSNPDNRCYHCKKISSQALKKRAGELGFACIADGMNVSDLGEHRPGLQASTEEGIIHPFIEAAITKLDIRAIAQDRGLPVWQKPSAACLSSRIPYGNPITRENLGMIEVAEAYLSDLGIGQLRVRLHGTVARIEVHNEDRDKILGNTAAIVQEFREIGFHYVTLDLEGYRTGSMDEVLEPADEKGRQQ